MRGPIERDFPANGSSRQKLEFALKYAVLAPTESLWPPWDFRASDTYLELIAKDDQSPGAADPDGREVQIGCGAALVYLKTALKHFKRWVYHGHSSIQCAAGKRVQPCACESATKDSPRSSCALVHS
jgi:hypothetical protein